MCAWRHAKPSLQLFGSVGPDQENEPDDVANVGSTLVGLGLPGAQRATETGAWDNQFDDSVRTFQENNGLDVDGILLPGGPTQSTINRSLEAPRRADANVPWSPRRDPLAPAGEARAQTIPDRSEASWADNLLVSPRDKSARPENPFSIARREFGNDRNKDNWWRGDAKPAPTAYRSTNALHKGPELGQAAGADVNSSLTNGLWRELPAQPASASPTLEEEERILKGRGYRYMPDPMGRVGWGDWVDTEGKLLDPTAKQAAIDDALGVSTRQSAQVADAGLLLPRGARNQHATAGDAELETFFAQSNRLSPEQAETLAQSQTGMQLRESFGRLERATNADGTIPLAVWREEARRLGIEPGQIGSRQPELTPVTDDDPSSVKDKTNRTFFGKAWSWLTDEIPGLAEQKARAIEQLDAQIREIESQPRWRSNYLNLVAMQSLLEARTGLIGGFPTSRLDFALMGVDIVGVAMIGARPVLILQKGNKIITSTDFAANGFRSKQALDLGKDVPYDSHLIRTWLEQRYGKDAIISTTIPRADYYLIQLAGKRHPVTKIPFDLKGYPIFDDVAKFDTRISSQLFWKGARESHHRNATLQLREAMRGGQVDAKQFDARQLEAIMRGEERIPGLTWHHHQDLGRMQLVPTQIHEDTKHLGGRGLRKGK